jgi:FKBP-type peptidyl-prolyl cis-trans isomerase (trigger factor)
MVVPEFRPSGIRKWIGRFEMGGTFKFAVASDVPPSLSFVDINGITVALNTDDPASVVDEQLHHLRHDLAIKAPSGKPSTELDEIVCSITTRDEAGAQIPEMSISSFPISLDLQKENLLSRTMAAQLLGRTPGEVVEFSEDGMTYTLSIEAVNTKTLPALDDALAQRCGLQSIQELREKIHEEWLMRNAARIRRDLHMQVREQLVSRNPFAVPPSWVDDYRDKVSSLVELTEASQDNEEQILRFARIYAASDYLLEILEEKFADEVVLSDADLLNYAKEELGVSGVKPEDYIKVMLAKGQYDSWVIQQKKTKMLDWLIAKAK